MNIPTNAGAKCAIYVRGKTSLARSSQELKMRDYIGRKGLPEPAVFIDMGASASEGHRPDGINAALVFCQVHPGTDLVIEDWNRLSRDGNSLKLIRDLFSECSTRIHLTDYDGPPESDSLAKLIQQAENAAKCHLADENK